MNIGREMVYVISEEKAKVKTMKVNQSARTKRTKRQQATACQSLHKGMNATERYKGVNAIEKHKDIPSSYYAWDASNLTLFPSAPTMF